MSFLSDGGVEWVAQKFFSSSGFLVGGEEVFCSEVGGEWMLQEFLERWWS